MSSKANASCKTIATRSDKNIVESKQPSSTSEAPLEDLVLYDNCNTLIEVTVKTKGRKRTSTMVSSNPISHKGVEEKRKPGSSCDSHSNWGRVLREQNRATMKQTLQHVTVKAPAIRPTKIRSDSKDIKKPSLNNQKNDPKHLDEIPIKQTLSQKKLEDQTKGTPRTSHPSTTSLPSSAKSVLVIDRRVQCSGIFDSIDRYGAFNPVRTLGFLMKELEDLVKDDKASKILTDMEQVLLRLSADSGKSFTMDTGAMALRSKLEATTLQLEDTTREMNAMCETWREERDSLKRQVVNQITLLNEAREMQLNTETTIKALKNDLEEAIKIAQSREKTVTELKEGMKNQEFSQKVITDLRASVAEQSELARHRHLEVQYLTLEKDKLLVLCSHKDSLLVELRNSIKELQSQITDQLSSLNIYVQEESINSQISLLHRGHACSSPTSSSSQESNMPTSWHDVSDVSLSTIGHEPPKNMDHRKFMRKSEKITAASESHIGNLEQMRTKANKDYPAKDSTNLEFVSLPCGESSLTLLPSYKDFGCTENSQSSYSMRKEKELKVAFSFLKVNTQANKGKEDSTLVQRRSENLRSLKNLSSPPEKLSGTKSREEEMPKAQKSLELQRKQTLGKKPSLIDDCSQLKSNLANNLTGSSKSEVFNNILHDIRMQSRMPVKIPSPPRNYPHPDWSDSTLPSISTASELNVIPSNDT